MAKDPILHSQIYAELGEFGKFERVSGGAAQIGYTDHTEAGAKTAIHIPATSSFTDIVLERAYRPDQDAALRNWFEAFRNGTEVGRNVTKFITNYQGIVVDQETYPLCEPSELSTPDGAAGDASVGLTRITLKVEQKQ